MNRWHHLPSVFLAAAGLTGCVGYHPPTAGPIAEMRFIHNDGLSYVDTENSCKTRRMVTEDSVQIRAGQPIWIEQSFLRAGYFTARCQYRLMFTPEPDATYQAEFEWSAASCRSNLYRIGLDGTKSQEPFAMSEPIVCF